jgi:hypothetical protein
MPNPIEAIKHLCKQCPTGRINFCSKIFVRAISEIWIGADSRIGPVSIPPSMMTLKQFWRIVKVMADAIYTLPGKATSLNIVFCNFVL